MTPIAHLASGYLITQTIDFINPGLGFGRPEIVIPTIIGAVISDIDILFAKNVKDHRDSIFHLPFFWLTVLMIGYFILPTNIIIGFGLGMFSHIFFDWLTVEEKGMGDMKLFYPFSEKKFAFRARKTIGKQYSNNILSLEYAKFYIKSRFFFFEIFFFVLGLLVFLVKSHILK